MRLRKTGKNRTTLDLDDLGGFARAEALLGDLDGSGDTPVVGLEITHVHVTGSTAVLAMSAREAEALARALTDMAERIRPHERLKTRHARLKAGR